MAANVPDPMKREREHPRFTSEPKKIDRRFLMYVLKVKPCTLDRCEDPAKCVLKHPGEQGRRDPSHFRYSPKLCPSFCDNLSCPKGNTCEFSHGLLESFFHPEGFIGIGALKLNFDRYARTEARLKSQRPLLGAWNFVRREREASTRFPADLLKSQRAAIELILHLNSIGRICGYKRHGALLRDRSFDKTANDIAIARAARDAMSKHAYGLPKTTTGSTYFPDNHFGNVYHPFGNVQWNFAVTSPVRSSRLDWHVGALCMAGEFPDDDDMVEPEDLKLDSGASNHAVGEKTLLHGYEKLPRPWFINVADGHPLEVVGTGSIITERFSIPKVYRVKGLKSNLISVSQLATDHGLFSVFDGRICEVLKSDWREKVGAGFLHANGIYKLSFLEVPEADGGGDENA